MVCGGLGNLVAGLFFSCLGRGEVLPGHESSCSDKAGVGESGGVGSLGFLGLGDFLLICTDNLLFFNDFGDLSGVCG